MSMPQSDMSLRASVKRAVGHVERNSERRLLNESPCLQAELRTQPTATADARADTTLSTLVTRLVRLG